MPESNISVIFLKNFAELMSADAEKLCAQRVWGLCLKIPKDFLAAVKG